MVVIGDLSARQLANAEQVINAALPYGAEAVLGALMAAGAESSYLRYANDGTSKRTDVSVAAKRLAATSLDYPHDAVAPRSAASVPVGTWDTTADSIGMYQQRPMYGYGTPAELMDIATSTRIFITGNKAGTTRAFLKAPADLSLPAKVQWTQGSEFPTGDNYAPFAFVAAQLFERYGPPPTTSPTPVTDWIKMADQAALDKYRGEISADLKDGDGHSGRDLAERLDVLRKSLEEKSDETKRALELRLDKVQETLDAILAKGNQA